ncbi:hypothetical protein OJ253_710 [Cryptosporidium canis]|uniref:Signal peptide-containing protein n=1 Tax=Cryptosporidium canis TaxID=195482 RepID=A0A9D5HZR1_9CRYT|nr:hypothetical protein OJ253_710 [Cryptosporidium canis]
MAIVSRICCAFLVIYSALFGGALASTEFLGFKLGRVEPQKLKINSKTSSTAAQDGPLGVYEFKNSKNETVLESLLFPGYAVLFDQSRRQFCSGRYSAESRTYSPGNEIPFFINYWTDQFTDRYWVLGSDQGVICMLPYSLETNFTKVVSDVDSEFVFELASAYEPNTTSSIIRQSPLFDSSKSCTLGLFQGCSSSEFVLSLPEASFNHQGSLLGAYLLRQGLPKREAVPRHCQPGHDWDLLREDQDPGLGRADGAFRDRQHEIHLRSEGYLQRGLALRRLLQGPDTRGLRASPGLYCCGENRLVPKKQSGPTLRADSPCLLQPEPLQGIPPERGLLRFVGLPVQLPGSGGPGLWTRHPILGRLPSGSSAGNPAVRGHSRGGPSSGGIAGRASRRPTQPGDPENRVPGPPKAQDRHLQELHLPGGDVGQSYGHRSLPGSCRLQDHASDPTRPAGSRSTKPPAPPINCSTRSSSK